METALNKGSERAGSEKYASLNSDEGDRSGMDGTVKATPADQVDAGRLVAILEALAADLRTNPEPVPDDVEQHVEALCEAMGKGHLMRGSWVTRTRLTFGSFGDPAVGIQPEKAEVFIDLEGYDAPDAAVVLEGMVKELTDSFSAVWGGGVWCLSDEAIRADRGALLIDQQEKELAHRGILILCNVADDGRWHLWRNGAQLSESGWETRAAAVSCAVVSYVPEGEATNPAMQKFAGDIAIKYHELDFSDGHGSLSPQGAIEARLVEYDNAACGACNVNVARADRDVPAQQMEYISSQTAKQWAALDVADFRRIRDADGIYVAATLMGSVTSARYAEAVRELAPDVAELVAVACEQEAQTIAAKEHRKERELESMKAGKPSPAGGGW